MPTNVADYIAIRLKEQNVDVIFGVPGITCAEVFEAASRQGISVIINSSDLEAGYAADGYARMRGLGAVSVSYGTGTLSLVNAIAGAFVERSPVVVINGGPSTINSWNQRRYGILFSHSIGREQTDLRVLEEVTALAVSVDRVSDVAGAVDHAITVAITKKRPVYIEVPKHVWYQDCPAPAGPLDLTLHPSGSEDDLANKILELLATASAPALMLGEEIQRYGIADNIATLIDKLCIPWVTTPLAKSVLAEQSPGFVGVYDGRLAPTPVRELVENADVLVALGCAFGIGHTHLVARSFDRITHAYDGWVRIGQNVPKSADLYTLICALERLAPEPKSTFSPLTKTAGLSYRDRRAWVGATPVEEGLTYEELFASVSDFLDDSWIVVSDIYLGLYPAADLNVFGRDAFVSNAVWASIGHSVAAAIGIGFATNRRPLVLCGDGGFQMTAQSLSTIARHNLEAVVVVIDNGMYGIEQFLLNRDFYRNPTQKPLPYVTLNRWDYTELASAMGFNFVLTVDTSSELEAALAATREWDGPGLIRAVVKSRTLPPELQKLL